MNTASTVQPFNSPPNISAKSSARLQVLPCTIEDWLIGSCTCFYILGWVAQQQGYLWRMSERKVMISSVSVAIMWTPTVPLSVQENGKRTPSVLLPSWHSLFSGRVVCQRKWKDRPLTMQQRISAVEWTSGGGTVADSWRDKNSPGDFHRHQMWQRCFDECRKFRVKGRLGLLFLFFFFFKPHSI